MKNQINFIYYPSTANTSSELADKLKESGQELSIYELRGDKDLTADVVDKEALVNALILSQEDMEKVMTVEWSTFPKQNTINKHIGVSVAFCIDCQDIPASLYDYFVVKEVKNSAESIRKELMQLHHLLYQKTKGRYGDFVGRNNEIEQFQNILYSERASKTTSFVVSGRQGVGREAFVRECIRQDKGQREYEPYTLSIGRNSNIELFLIQLNSICRNYSEDAFVQLLKGGTEEKVEAAVAMLNSLFQDDDYLVLYDDGGSCIRYNRKLSEWFKTVVTHPMLHGGIHLYVISNISVSYSRITTEDDVAYITLYGLSLSDRKKLLYKCLSNHEEIIPEDQIQLLADKLVYSPSQLVKVVEDIKAKDSKYVISHLNDYQVAGDNRIISLFKNYDTPEHPEARDLLVLLSKIEYVSRNILRAIYPKTMPEIEEEIDRFMAGGIVERFGEWMDLIRLDSSVSDYLRRNKISYRDKTMQGHVTDTLADLINEKGLITEDYSTYLYRIRQGVRKGRFSEESYLVPSVLVNTISEAYDGRDWGMTIKLCENILSSRPNYFQEVYREIRYWYCLALARMGNEEKLHQQLQYFYGADLHFLKGFYLRIKKEYSKAEAEYQKTLSISPGMSRAKREMVLVLQAQHKFSSALEMAETNYERDPENAYHVHAYFRCLVRKKDITYEDRQLLKNFMEDSDNLFKSKFYTEGMKFEYSRFIDRVKPDVLLLKANELLQKYPEATYIKDVVNEYRVSQGMGGHLVPVDFSDDFNI